MTVALRPYQHQLRTAITDAWHAGARNVLAVSPTGSGKCLGRGTPVMLFDGRVVPVESVRVGDRLMGPDSKPRKVLSVTSGVEPLYRVTPTKGDPYVVNESHILSLRMTGGSRHSCGIASGTVVNLGVLDYLSRPKTFHHCAKGWRVGVEFNARQPEGIAPYILGLWLGDGTSRHLSVTTGDGEIMAELATFAARQGLQLRFEANSPGSVTVHVVERLGVSGWSGRRGAKPNAMLRQYGLVQNKHIPHEFKTADRATRLAVLAGLLDADGHLAGGGFDLTLVNERLLDDAIFVARSLGFACYKTTTQKTCHNNGVRGTYFRCFISGDVAAIPCRVKRKQAPPRLQRKDVLSVGIKVEPIGPGDYFGFEIDGDRLFLLGDFTVTHNTVLFSDLLAGYSGASCAIAHRAELVSQISLALARNGVRHGIVAPDSTCRNIVAIHMAELGRSWYDPGSRVRVAGVDSLPRLERDPWAQQVGLWIQDEAHHVLRDNKWGRAVAMFPNARGLGVTATPTRADGRGLGAHADGVFERMVVGPTMRELIEAGYLTDYRVFCPPSDLDLSDVTVTAGGDFSPEPLRKAVHRSHIVGDVVSHYRRIAPGRLGVTFAVDVESATEQCAAFRAAGVPAEVVTSKTPDALRIAILRRFRAREVLQLVNVDLFGEGFDLPAIEVVSMARPTQSYGLYVQQFGRALRPLEGKAHALVIDHVGNVVRHGLPDKPRVWSLDRRERRSNAGSTIPLRICPQCTQPYERVNVSCPWCGHTPEPVGRSTPAEVDGDLIELSPEVLARMRGEVARVDGAPWFPQGLEPLAQAGLRKRHAERQQAQHQLREAIALWGGVGARPADVRRAQREFFHRFHIDVMSAQALGRPEAEALEAQVRADLT